MLKAAVSAVSMFLLLEAVCGTRAARGGDKEEARKHYDRAVELVDDGQLPEAIIEFQRSYDLTKHFSVLYNLGQVYVSMAKPVEAIAAYEGYLVGGGNHIPKKRRAEVETELARQKTRIANLVFRVLPEGATIRLDGNDIGKTPIPSPVPVTIGEHHILASAEGHESFELKVTMASEDRRTIEATLVALPEKKVEPEAAPLAPVGPDDGTSPPSGAAVALTSEPATSPPPDPTLAVQAVAAPIADVPGRSPSMTGTRIVGIVAAVAGFAGLLTAPITWLTATSRHDEAVSYWNQEGDDAQARSLQSEAEDYAVATNVLVIAGATLVATGAVLYIVGRPATQSAPSAGHGYVSPAVGPGFAGVRAGATW